MKANNFNEYPHYVYATVFLANGIPLDYKIGDRKRTWHERTFRGFYFWESYVWNHFGTLNLECKYIETLVSNDEEHNKAFEELGERIKSGKYE